jgi:ABC-type multidrug transport system fused ATPase/permease subunit
METLDARPEVTDAPDAVSLTHIDVVAFDNVSFEYVPGRPVLHACQFPIEPGQTAAFVGPSGAGKSTLLSLLLRLEDPASGCVLIDGHDLKRVRLRSYLDRWESYRRQPTCSTGPCPKPSATANPCHH